MITSLQRGVSFVVNFPAFTLFRVSESVDGSFLVEEHFTNFLSGKI